MKDKLEPDMYVRTKYGIFKIRKITKDLAYCRREKRVIELDRNIPEYNYRFSFYKDESIFKGAKFKNNIIDLIEVGDFVNGKQVIETYYKSDEKWHLEIVDSRLLTHDELKHVNIQSIVTKEQFSQMEYKVGDDK